MDFYFFGRCAFFPGLTTVFLESRDSLRNCRGNKQLGSSSMFGPCCRHRARGPEYTPKYIS